MAEHKTSPPNHKQENTDGQQGSGRQHPTGAGPAYRAPKERGSARGKEGGKRDRHQGPAGDEA